MTPGILPSALRAAAVPATFKIAPGDFVEPEVLILVRLKKPAFRRVPFLAGGLG
jgi:hypothetical protein